ncbi:MAG: hypothetical protein ACR2PZ_01515 [Pseudomonadales bacterium]
MTALDFARALGVATAVIVITMAASFPMVAFYAYIIEPGHSEEFYTAAAQWIAPWSSHILGPIAFLGFNYFLAKRSPERSALLFAVATLGLYVVVDLSMLPMMGLPIADGITLSTTLSFLAKTAGALLGAYLGSRRQSAAREPSDAA